MLILVRLATACYIGDSTFATIAVHNCSNVLAFFSFGDMGNRAFAVHPPMGMIEPKGFALVCLRFHPTEVCRVLDVIRILRC